MNPLTEKEKEYKRNYSKTPKQIEYRRQYAKREHVKQKARQYRKSQKWKEYYSSWQKSEHRKEYQKKYKQKNGFKYYLKGRYNITIEQYTEMFLSQNGKCAICHEPIVTRECSVDHNHETGQVRGLLCNNCNFSIGLLKDNFIFAYNTAKYLAKWQYD